MDGLIGIAIVIGLIWLAATYWYIVLALVVIGAAVYFLIEANKKSIAWEKDQEAQRVAREAQLQKQKETQKAIQTDLIKLCDESLRIFEAMPKNLLDAESLLDKAEEEFKEGAFAPFWDSVQNAAIRLGQFNNCVEGITGNSKRHSELTKTFESEPPRFPIVLDSVRGMAAANTTSNRMSAIVRKAQCNFQFATIYEQRRTNQLLIAGFQNLAQAIDGLGDRIISSIDGLSYQISEMSSSLSESLAGMNTNLEELHSTIQEHHSTVQKEMSGQTERHNRALEMLDNIQRRRIPYPRGIRDGAY